MDNEHTHLAKTDLNGEEQFTLVTIDYAKGAVTHTSGPMSEIEFREDFAKRGMPLSEIESHLASARSKFKAGT